MGLDELVQIEVISDVGIAHHHVFLFLVRQKIHDAGQGLHAAAVHLDVGLGVGGHQIQAAPLAGEVPLTAGAQMVHQGMVVLLDDDGDIADARVGETGQHEVDHAVAPAEGDGRHRALGHHLGDQAVICIGENDAQGIRVGLYHCSSPSFTSLTTMALGPTLAFTPMVTPSPTTATPQLSRLSMSSGRSPTTAPLLTVTFSAMME